MYGLPVNLWETKHVCFTKTTVEEAKGLMIWPDNLYVASMYCDVAAKLKATAVAGAAILIAGQF